eukprot:9189454-Heterocapsa_arctica.AAC.1
MGITSASTKDNKQLTLGSVLMYATLLSVVVHSCVPVMYTFDSVVSRDASADMTNIISIQAVGGVQNL